MKVVEHRLIVPYQDKMRKERRCAQCVSPWHDGICSCQKWGKEQEFVKEMALRLIRDGWAG